MKYFSYGLIVSIFLVFFGMIYYASFQGWGASPLNNSGKRNPNDTVRSYRSSGGYVYIHGGNRSNTSGSRMRTGSTSRVGSSGGSFRSGSRAGRGK
jgi:hypothetical protein